MERLQAADWLIIERFLKNMADQQDLLALHELCQQHPKLKEVLEKSNAGENKSATAIFNADDAFLKLHERLKDENLL